MSPEYGKDRLNLEQVLASGPELYRALEALRFPNVRQGAKEIDKINLDVAIDRCQPDNLCLVSNLEPFKGKDGGGYKASDPG